jgi:hypothetical protein
MVNHIAAPASMGATQRARMPLIGSSRRVPGIVLELFIFGLLLELKLRAARGLLA